MTEQKVYVAHYSVKTRDFTGTEILADPKVLGVFRNRVDAQDCINQFLDGQHTWENYEILERELV